MMFRLSSPHVARRAGVALALAAALLATGCPPITVEIMPKHYHGCESREAAQAADAGVGTGEDDALAPEYVAEQTRKLTEAMSNGK